MNKNSDRIVKEFIVNVKNELCDIIEFGYAYCEDENLFRIWHNNADFNDIEFKRIIGKNIKVYLFENDIFNISVAFNRDKAMEISKIYNVVQESRTYTEHLKFKTLIASQSKNYNHRVESEFETVNGNFTIGRPKLEMILSEQINTNISNAEVLAA